MRKLSIVHLEDSQDDAFLIDDTLKRDGINAEISVVRSGKDYLAAIEQMKPDLILLDNGLPGFDGAEAISAARNRIPGVPLIVVSGSTDDKLMRDRLKAGACDYVSKDRLWTLPAAIRRAVSGTQDQKGAYL